MAILYTPDTPDRTYYINMIPGGVPTIIYASQYEHLGRLYFYFVNHDGSIRELVQTSNSGEMICVCPDGKKITIPMSVKANNNRLAFVSVVPAYGLTDVAGDVWAEFELAYEYGWTPEWRGPRTANFIIRVEPSPEEIYRVYSGGSISDGGNGGADDPGSGGDDPILKDIELPTKNLSWTEIKQAADGGTLTNILSVGDIMPKIELEGLSPLYFVAAKVADNYAYFMSTFVLDEYRKLKSGNSYGWNASGNHGFYYSDGALLRNYLNGADFYDKLPADLKAAITPRVKSWTNVDGYYTTDIWIPYIQDVLGSNLMYEEDHEITLDSFPDGYTDAATNNGVNLLQEGTWPIFNSRYSNVPAFISGNPKSPAAYAEVQRSLIESYVNGWWTASEVNLKTGSENGQWVPAYITGMGSIANGTGMAVEKGVRPCFQIGSGPKVEGA